MNEEEEINEETEEEEKYNPFEDSDIFSITASKIDMLFKEEACLLNDCKKEIEIYDVSYIYTYPFQKFKTFEVGLKTPVYMHVALWKELLKACELMEFAGEESFSEDSCILYMNRVQFDVPAESNKRRQLFIGIRKLKETVRYMLDHIPDLMCIRNCIENIDWFT